MMNKILPSCFLAALFVTMIALPANAQRFGSAVLIVEDQVLVGEPENDYKPGTVYVYSRGGGTWTRVEEIQAPAAELGDHFGRSLAWDGDRLLVGSTGVDGKAGVAYVFERASNGRWKHSATLTASDVVADDGFGAAVAIHGDDAFVAAPSRRQDPGKVYIFNRQTDGNWTQQGQLAASDSASGVDFGRAIAVEDGTAYIGAPAEANGTGAVYVYTKGEAGWSETNILTSRRMGEDSGLGASVAVDGDLLVAGAVRHAGRIGAAIAFHRNSETGEWENATILQPYAADSFFGFGSALAAADGTVLIGAPTAGSFAGAVYVYRYENGNWLTPQVLPNEQPERRDFMGAALDVAGPLAAVGITGDDYGAGSVTIYRRSGDAWHAEAKLESEDTGLKPIVGEKVSCEDGEAALFDCEQVDLLSFLPISSIGGERGVNLNDIWGWTDPDTGREYALVGRVDGTSFVDITDPENPRYLGNLPRTEGTPGSSWRDIKVYKNYAFIVADGAADHGMQIFDLTQLRDVAGEPVLFEETAHYNRINSAHNIVIDTESGFAYAVGNSNGGETCGGGLHMINIENPTKPEFVGCFADESTGRAGTGYSHDAQCLVYRGPDDDYQGRQICFGSNETALSIADVTDKKNPVAVAAAAYPNVSYTHQGWISEDHRYFYVNDELDEISGNVPETRTLIWDITDLDDPQLVNQYMWGNKSSDHNLYIRGNLMYQSNYSSGLRIHDISDPENPIEVGYFDTMPVGDNGPGFAGSWSNYPYFASGTIAVSSIGEGLFLLRKKRELGL